MLQLKEYHSEALRKEQVRANEAEEALKRFSSMEEERIGQLGKLMFAIFNHSENVLESVNTYTEIDLNQ